jgi:S-formylglutathione hydrolase FrmB
MSPVKPALRIAFLILLAGWGEVSAGQLVPHPLEIQRVNRQLSGQLIDYTANHGHDNRIWAPSLQQKRDLYVYLPPGYCAEKRYPVIFFLHGFNQDELIFLRKAVLPLDRAIVTGELPPMILIAPDGSRFGRPALIGGGTFFLNSRAGNFEDFLIRDVFTFVTTHYSVRPERGAHCLFGVSMGGGSAYTQSFKHPELFGVVVGIFPPLNLRWMSCRGRYRDNFDPDCWGWRTDFDRDHEVIARFAGVITIRLRQLIVPLYGRRNPDTLQEIIENNPIEMLDLYDIKPGQFEMYVAYGGKDEFNLDAQVESFLYRAKQKCLPITVDYDPKGRHNARTALEFLPSLFRWLKPRLEPYAPPG